ncbi:MAG TPA: hypothetical protein VFE46_01985, partial [Pirellulales bacterium]|nr:hypothetical protein [Pirellulales bacterium]
AMMKKTLPYHFACFGCGATWYLHLSASKCPYCEKPCQSRRRKAQPKHLRGASVKLMPFNRFCKELFKLDDPEERSRALARYKREEIRRKKDNDNDVELPF